MIHIRPPSATLRSDTTPQTHYEDGAGIGFPSSTAARTNGVRKIIMAGKPIPVFGEGSAARDYTFVTDTVEGILACTQRELGYEIFNLGESQVIALRRMPELLETALGKKAAIDRQPRQPGDVPVTCANIDKAREKPGYYPQVKI